MQLHFNRATVKGPAALLIASVLASCVSPTKITRVLSTSMSVNVTVAPTANSNSAVAVDLVLIKDKQLLRSLRSMTSQDWFAQREKIVRQQGDRLKVMSWEWVPGQAVPPIRLPVQANIEGAEVFAGYAAPGSHSAFVPVSKIVSIYLGENDFQLYATSAYH